jgi:hypothetical protein
MASFARQESRCPSSGPYCNWPLVDNRISEFNRSSEGIEPGRIASGSTLPTGTAA